MGYLIPKPSLSMNNSDIIEPLDGEITWFIYFPKGFISLCLPPDRTGHKFNDPKVDYSGDILGGGCRAPAKARPLLDYADHRPT